MYEEYYGLSEDPFRLSPHGRYSFEHSSYRKARSYLEYALHRGEGIVLICGTPGTGKTTLIKSAALSFRGSQVQLNILSCNRLDAHDLITLYASDLGVQSESEDIGSILVGIGTELLRLNRSGVRPVLVLDEAQGLTIDALEQARLLTNYQVGDRPLLQIVLVGQPELRQKVLSPSLAQLHQRIISSTMLSVLNTTETRDYFMHRLTSVGWNNNPYFHGDVFRVLHKASEGIPRWINQIGSRLLLHGMVEEKNEITAADIRRVVVDLVDETLLPSSVRTTQIRAVASGGNGLLDSEY